MTISVEVEDEAWREALPDVDRIVRAAAGGALHPPPPGEAAAPCRPSLSPRDALRARQSPSFAGRVQEELTILLTGDEAVRDLNARFRGKERPTNVLSFPAPETAAPHLGDIALAYGVCVGEAAEQGKSLARHLSHLVAHGVLHLLGYDHERPDEAEAMEARERAIMAALGWPDPYLLPEQAADHA